MPVIRGGRPDKAAMPPIPMPDDDMKAIAEYIHSVAAMSPRQGMPPPSDAPPALNVLVGDAAAGGAYFAAKCATCHSLTAGVDSEQPSGHRDEHRGSEGAAELLGVGRTPAAAGGRAARRGAPPRPGAPNPRAVTATVTTAVRRKDRRPPLRIDDFFVAVMLDDGTIRSFTRRGASPKVEIKDPLEPHRALLAVLHRQGHARRHGLPGDTEMTLKQTARSPHRCCLRRSRSAARARASIPRTS